MVFINKTYAEAGPNSWPENMKECKIKWEIVYYKNNELNNDCYHFYDWILKDQNNYYIVTLKQILPSHIYYWETTSNEVICEEYSMSWSINNYWINITNSIIPKKWDEYYFTVRKFYDYDNFVVQYSKEESPEWTNLKTCDFNIIDKIENNTSYKDYFIIWTWIISLIILWIIIYRKFKK